MNHFILDEHTAYCEMNRNKLKGTQLETWANVCQRNPHHFVFFLGVEFHLLTYYGCLEHGSHLDWKQEVVQQVLEGSKKVPLYKVQRERLEKDRFNEFVFRGTPLQTTIKQVNYLYYSNSYTRYAITTEMPFIESFFNVDKVENNRREAIAFLKREKLDHYCSEVDDLFEENIRGLTPSNATIIKTVNQITKIINKQNGQQQESEQQRTA